MSFLSRMRVRKNSAGSIFTRRQINLIEGTNVTITVGDDAGNDEVDVVIAAAGGSGAVATDAIWDAKGDLAAGTGADAASRVAVGANDTMLVADSAQSTGVKWSAALSGAWTPFTPTWTGAISNPAIGNGTLTGAYIVFGKLLVWWSRMSAGSTTTFGSGVWSIGIPTGTPINNGQNIVASVRDAGVARYVAATTLNVGGTFSPFKEATATQWQSTSPMIWGNGDEWYAGGTIQLT